MMLVHGFYTIESTKENIDDIISANRNVSKEENNRLLDLLLPTPVDLLNVSHSNRLRMKIKYGVCDCYEWRMANWGCKYDFDIEVLKRISDTMISFYADTPWYMPVEGITKLEKIGYKFTAIGYSKAGNLYYKHTFDNTTIYEKSLEDIPKRVVDELIVHFGQNDFILGDKEDKPIHNKRISELSIKLNNDIKMTTTKPDSTVNTLKQALDKKKKNQARPPLKK